MVGNKRLNIKKFDSKFILKLSAFIITACFIMVANIYSGKKNQEGSAELLVEDEYLPKFIADAAGAEKLIYCAMYMFKVDSYSENNLENPTGLLASSLINAAERGVEVAIILDEGDEDDLTTKFNKKTVKILEKNGIKVKFYPPERCLHSKLCLIDEKILFIGSHNYTYSAMNRNSETSVRIFSEKIGKDAIRYLSKLGM